MKAWALWLGGLGVIACPATAFAQDYFLRRPMAGIEPSNHAPGFTTDPVTAVAENSSYLYELGVADEDAGQSLTISLDDGPEWLSLDPLDPEAGTATLSGTSVAGSYSVVLTVTDDGVPALSASQGFTLTVGDVPCAPATNPQVWSSDTSTLVTIPAGCTSATVSLWGGGGAPGGTNNTGNFQTSGQGGAGGYTHGDVDLTGLSQLRVIVGTGGGRCGGGGGMSGGLSGIFESSTASQANAILIAGGGGAGGRGISGQQGGDAGAGGGASGQDGTNGNLARLGYAGTQSAAGSGYIAGSGMQGGKGQRGNLASDCGYVGNGFNNQGGGHGGGGGGGGYWGGAGGGGSGERGSGGGGGSGYIGSARVSNAATHASSRGTMATQGSDDPDYCCNAGRGGHRYNATYDGSDGMVVIHWAE